MSLFFLVVVGFFQIQFSYTNAFCPPGEQIMQPTRINGDRACRVCNCWANVDWVCFIEQNPCQWPQIEISAITHNTKNLRAEELPIFTPANKRSEVYPIRSALRYGFQKTNECNDFEKAYLCVRKCIDHGFDTSHSDKKCKCRCFKNKDKGQYTVPRKMNSTKWKLGAPTTSKPYWAQPAQEDPIIDEEVLKELNDQGSDETGAEGASEAPTDETTNTTTTEGAPEGPTDETTTTTEGAPEGPTDETTTTTEGAPEGSTDETTTTTEGAPEGSTDETTSTTEGTPEGSTDETKSTTEGTPEGSTDETKSTTEGTTEGSTDETKSTTEGTTEGSTTTTEAPPV